MTRPAHVIVPVHGHLGAALTKLKRYMTTSGTVRESRRHEYALTRSETRRRKEALARRRRLKALRREVNGREFH